MIQPDYDKTGAVSSSREQGRLGTALEPDSGSCFQVERQRAPFASCSSPAVRLAHGDRQRMKFIEKLRALGYWIGVKRARRQFAELLIRNPAATWQRP